jgi:hypothetical protein
MNGYIAFFNGRKTEVHAHDLYSAKQKAIEFFKPRKSQAHMVSVMLAEKDGKPVVHNTGSL